MKTEKDALRPLEWLKIDMDHVSAVLEYKYGNQFLQMLKTTARRRGVVETCDMPELVADRVIVEMDGGFIPACMLQSLQASNKFVSCGRNGGITTQSRKPLISEATLEATLEATQEPAIKPPLKLVRVRGEDEDEKRESNNIPPPVAAAPKRSKKSADPMVQPPPSIDAETWRQFYEHRLGHRVGPMTENAQRLMLKRLEGFQDSKAAMETAIAGGWSDCKEWASVNRPQFKNRHIDDTPPQGLKTGNYPGETF